MFHHLVFQSWCARAGDKSGIAGRMASHKRIKPVSKYLGSGRAVSHYWRKVSQCGEEKLQYWTGIWRYQFEVVVV